MRALRYDCPLNEKHPVNEVGRALSGGQIDFVIVSLPKTLSTIRVVGRVQHDEPAALIRPCGDPLCQPGHIVVFEQFPKSRHRAADGAVFDVRAVPHVARVPQIIEQDAEPRPTADPLQQREDLFVAPHKTVRCPAESHGKRLFVEFE